MKHSHHVKSRSWGQSLGKVECTEEISASPMQNSCFWVVPLQIQCAYTHMCTSHLSEVETTACSLEFLPLGIPGWLKGWAKEAGYLLQPVGNRVFAQSDLLCFPTWAELEYWVALNFPRLFPEYLKSPPSPRAQANLLPQAPSKVPLKWSSLRSHQLQEGNMSLLLQPLSRRKSVSCLDVYCCSCPFTLSPPFPQAATEKKETSNFIKTTCFTFSRSILYWESIPFAD